MADGGAGHLPTFHQVCMTKIQSEMLGIMNALNNYKKKKISKDFATSQIKHLIAGKDNGVTDKYLNSFENTYEWSNNASARWNSFKATWQDGNGSWTNSLKIMAELYDSIRQVDL